jgi:hypothetical protein
MPLFLSKLLFSFDVLLSFERFELLLITCVNKVIFYILILKKYIMQTYPHFSFSKITVFHISIRVEYQYRTYT